MARSPFPCAFIRRCIPFSSHNPRLCKHLPRIRTRRIHTPSAEEVDAFGSYSLILPPEPFVQGVRHIPVRPVPDNIRRPPYACIPPDLDFQGLPLKDDGFAGDPYQGDERIFLGGEDEVKLRRATDLARVVLHRARGLTRVGMTTNQIDAHIHDFILSHEAYPSPLCYSGFPKACCTSVNNIIAHGIPDDRPLEDGDIINIDITVYLDGFHGDTSQTFLVGDVDRPGVELVRATTLALEAGIKSCGPHKPFAVIGHTIHNVATQHGYSINPQFTGHGIGRVFHQPPWILHHKNDEPGIMLPGHVFTIEPSLVQGSEARGWMFPDGWTVATESGARSAQAEHTVLITESGVDVLT